MDGKPVKKRASVFFRLVGLLAGRARGRRRLLAPAGCVLVLWHAALFAAAPLSASESTSQELTELALTDLMALEVISASRKPQSLGETASAVYIITAREVERSGATTIPELLRRVPGLHVARLDASSWAVTSRGFNHRYASKMLVQIDGRTVYSPLFAGVYWDAQDLLLDDIDRIEVIRGPGATMWGENAVNGVVNIITKRAADTRGIRVESVTGNEEASVAVRHGGGSDGFDHRVYVRGARQEPVARKDGSSAADALRTLSAGFRFDAVGTRFGSLSLDGQLFSSETDQEIRHASLVPPYYEDVAGHRRHASAFVGARFRPFAGEDVMVFGYAERTRRVTPDGFEEIRHTYELDYQQRHRSSEARHDLVWGGQVRYTDDTFENVFRVSLDPPARGLTLLSGFVQDEVAFDDRFYVTMGAKLTHNGFTGFEAQPSLRALVKLDPHQSLWGAVSRAVRTPARIERDMRLNAAVPEAPPGAPPTLVALLGGAIEPERLVAYEAGYRTRGNRVGLDVTVFSNHYDGLVTLELGAPSFEQQPSPPHVLVPLILTNGGPATTSGLESLVRVQPHDAIELQGWYSWFRLGNGFESTPEEGALIPEGGTADVPSHQARVDAHVTLTRRLSVDVSAHYVGGVDTQNVPSFVRFDLGFMWRVTPWLDLSVRGQNLLERRHPEFASDRLSVPFQIERAILARFVGKF